MEKQDKIEDDGYTPIKPIDGDMSAGPSPHILPTGQPQLVHLVATASLVSPEDPDEERFLQQMHRDQRNGMIMLVIVVILTWFVGALMQAHFHML